MSVYDDLIAKYGGLSGPEGALDTAVDAPKAPTAPVAPVKPMGYLESLERGSEAYGHKASPNEGVLDTVNRYQKQFNPFAGAIASARLEMARGLAGPQAIPRISSMSDKDVQLHLERFSETEIRPPADFAGTVAAGTEGWDPDRRDLYIRANWMAKVADDYQREREARKPGILTQGAVMATENVPYVAGFGVGGITAGALAKKGAFEVAEGAGKWAIRRAAGKRLAAQSVVPGALEGVTRYHRLASPEVAMDDAGMPTRVAPGVPHDEALKKAVAGAAIVPAVELVGGELAWNLLKPIGKAVAVKAPAWIVNKATGGRAGQAAQRLKEIGYKVGDLVPPLTPGVRKFNEAIGFRTLGTTGNGGAIDFMGTEFLGEEGGQAMVDAVLNLEGEYERGGLQNVPDAAARFAAEAPAMMVSLALMGGAARAGGIPAQWREKQTVMEGLQDFRDMGYEVPPDDRLRKGMTQDDRIHLLNQVRDIHQMRYLSEEGVGYHNLTMDEIASMAPQPRKALLDRYKAAWYQDRLTELGMPIEKHGEILSLDEPARNAALTDLTVNQVLERNGYADIEGMKPESKAEAVQEVWNRRLAEAAQSFAQEDVSGRSPQEHLAILLDASKQGKTKRAFQGPLDRGIADEIGMPAAVGVREGATPLDWAPPGVENPKAFGPNPLGGRETADLVKRAEKGQATLAELDRIPRGPVGWNLVDTIFRQEPAASIGYALRRAGMDEKDAANRQKASELRAKTRQPKAEAPVEPSNNNNQNAPAKGTPAAPEAITVPTTPKEEEIPAKSTPAAPGGSEPAMSDDASSALRAMAPQLHVRELSEAIGKDATKAIKELRDLGYVRRKNRLITLTPPGEARRDIERQRLSQRAPEKADSEKAEAPATDEDEEEPAQGLEDEVPSDGAMEVLPEEGAPPPMEQEPVNDVPAKAPKAEAKPEQAEPSSSPETPKFQPGDKVEWGGQPAVVDKVFDERRVQISVSPKLAPIIMPVESLKRVEVADQTAPISEGVAAKPSAVPDSAVAMMEAAIHRVMKATFGGEANYVVYRRWQAVPRGIVEDIARSWRKKPSEVRLAAFYKASTRQVGFVADLMADEARRLGMSFEGYALAKAMHEYGIHHGLRQMAREIWGVQAADELRVLLENIYTQVGTERIHQVIPKAYWNASPQVQAEEYLAWLAQNYGTDAVTDIDRSAWQRFVEWIRGFIERLTGPLSDGDIDRILRHAIASAKSSAAEDSQPLAQGVMREGPVTVDNHSEAAGQRVAVEPSEAQKEAGNYKKAHIRRDGFDITIENPAGSVRRGVDRSGKAWEQPVNHDYGYFRGTKGPDKDHVDVFINPGSAEGGTVYVVNQLDPGTGLFDEPKVMLGFGSEEQARRGYLSNFEPEWKGLGDVVPMTMEQFREWVYSDAPAKGPAVAPPRAVQEETPDSSKPELPSAPVEAPDPQIALADSIYEALMEHPERPSMAQDRLFRLADVAYGGTRSEGKYGPSDAYDALELAINRFMGTLKVNPNVPTAAAATAVLSDVRNRLEYVTSQKNRSGEKDTYQQFSTPTTYAYVAAWLANIGASDVVLEPSAGTGNIAVFAVNAGPKAVYANELSNKRGALLAQVPGITEVMNEDAEQLGNILPARGLQPTVVVMNPPFSRAAERMGAKKIVGTDLKHIDAALEALAPGGRLVAIVGAPLQGEETKTFGKWYNKVRQEFNVRAIVRVAREVYKPQGTTFPTRVIVIDKTGATPEKGTFKTTADLGLETLAHTLEGIRNERAELEGRGQAEQPAARQAVSTPSSEPEGAGERRVPVSDDVGGVVPGESQGGRAIPGVGTPSGAPGVGAGERGPSEGAPVPSEPGGKRPGRGARREPSDAARGDEPGGTGPGDGGESGNQSVSVQPQSQVTDYSGELTDAVFVPYQVPVSFPGAKSHPAAIVESAAMSAVKAPPITYSAKLPASVVEKGLLSDLQLEAIARAGQAHEGMLPAVKDERTNKTLEFRRGFMVGDGTGVGKGRIVSGIILDNLLQGRTKALWISISAKLFEDAKRDWRGLGRKDDEVFELGKTKIVNRVPRDIGIMFTTYATLRSKEANKGETKKAKGDLRSRVDQIVEWLGEDFDGALVFDEAHAMGNAVQVKGKRGFKKPSEQALAGLELQRRLPKARIVYVSATAATEVSNLAYTDRLGLWGEGRPFSNKEAFLSEVATRGVAAMEIVAQNMKAMGLFLARSLSMHDVEFDRVEHNLSPEQTEIYNTLAEAWQVVLNHIHAAVETTEPDKQARNKAYSQFWGAHQRFFNQVITTMAMPSTLERMKGDLDAGKSIVVQLTNTFEAAQEKKLKERDEGDDLEDFDLTPREVLIQYLEKSFPTVQYEKYIDADGNERQRPVTDSKGKPVENQAAIRARDALIERVGALRVPASPLDHLIDFFGRKAVAEVTGRKRRVVKDESGKTTVEKRGANANKSDISSFQDGKKRLLIFSEAGGTGASYHADRTAKNQQQRVHYLLQPGWRADRAVQGLGRSHRSNQAQPPIFVLVTTNLKGQKRFLSTIARRLEQLGALSKGQRQAGATGLFGPGDNIESSEAEDALTVFFRDLIAGRIEGIDVSDFERQTGLVLRDENGKGVRDLPEIRQFLNRLLSLSIDMQDRVFEQFDRRLQEKIELALADGTLDQGMETYRAKSIEKAEELTAHVDKDSGAEAKYVRVTVEQPLKTVPWKQIKKWQGNHSGVLGFVRNHRSGRVYLAVDAPAKTMGDGSIQSQAKLYSPNGKIRGIPRFELNHQHWETIPEDQQEQAWTEEHDATPKTERYDEHLLTGLVLPVWNRIAEGGVRLVRMLTNDKEQILGLLLNRDTYAETLRNLGITATGPKLSVDEQLEGIIDGRHALTLVNGWKIKRSRVGGENRIEVVVNSYGAVEQLRAWGAFSERIQYTTRVFIPMGEKAQEVFERIVSVHPVTQTDAVRGSAFEDGVLGAAAPEGTEALRMWFGNSKAANPDGTPKVLYHGTASVFTAFDPGRKGTATRHPTASLGFFMSASPEVARLFIKARWGTPEEQPALRALRDAEIEGAQAAGFGDVYFMKPHSPERKAVHAAGKRAYNDNNYRPGANIMPVYARIENPLELTWDDWYAAADWVTGTSAQGMEAILERVEAGNHDGLLLPAQPLYSPSDPSPREYDDDTWIAFRPEQIKSAIGNRGSFDADNPDILAAASSDESGGIALRGDEIPVSGPGWVKNLRQWAQKHIKDKRVRNRATGREMLLTVSGVDHTAGVAHGSKAAVVALAKLPELAESAVFVETRAPEKGKKSPMRVYEAPVTLGNEQVTIRLFFQEITLGAERLDRLDVFYHQTATKSPIAEIGSSAEPLRSPQSNEATIPIVPRAGEDVNPDILAAVAPDPAREQDAIDKATEWVLERVEKAARKHKYGRAAADVVKLKDDNARDDFSLLNIIGGTPQRYMEKLWSTDRMWKAVMNRARALHEIVQHFYGVDLMTGTDELKGIVDYERVHRDEYKARWQPYIFTRDRDAVGYKARKQGRAWEVLNPKGEVVGNASNEDAAWEQAYERERADAVSGRDWVRTPDYWIEERQVKPMSDAGANAILAYRRINHRVHQHLVQVAKTAREAYKDAGVPEPLVEMDGEMVSVFTALRAMGDRRGYYMPRLRKGGRFLLYATKAGEAPRLETFDTWTIRSAKAIKYAAQGWEVDFAVSTKPSEEAFLDAGVIALNDLLQGAIKELDRRQKEFGPEGFTAMGMEVKTVPYTRKTDGELEQHFTIASSDRRWNDLFKGFGGHRYDDGQNGIGEVWHFVATETVPAEKIQRDLLAAIQRNHMQYTGALDVFGRSIAHQLAIMLHSRGSRARKIGRNDAVGAEVWQGYETDPIKAVVSASSSVAGGTAKAGMARQMLNAFMGVETPWREFRQQNLPPNFDQLDIPQQRHIVHEIWARYRAEVEGRRLDSASQPVAYKYTQGWMREVLRNDEGLDRIMGTIRGLAALKYLTGLAPGLVNLTTLGTLLPAVMHQEANIPFATSLQLIGTTAKSYTQYLVRSWQGKPTGLDVDVQWLFDQIASRGWDRPLMHEEASQMFRSELGRGYRRIVDLAMMAFTVTERVNRATSIGATYRALAAQHKGALSPAEKEALLERAKRVSDQANATYGGENVPPLMRGGGLGSHTFKSMYMYRTYTHNLMQAMAEMGFSKTKKDRKALAYVMFSMPVLAGPQAMIFGGTAVLIGKALIEAAGGEPPEDPLEAFYAWAKETFGVPGERLARHGVVGLVGADISGSLSTRVVDVPFTFGEFMADPGNAEKRTWEFIGQTLAGPVGSMAWGVVGGARDIVQGDYARGAEKLAPRVLASPIRAGREYLSGVATKSGAPVFYGEERLYPSATDTVLRALSFNPSNVSARRQEQWAETKMGREYELRRGAVYDMVREWARSDEKTPAQWAEIVAAADAYNRDTIAQGSNAPLIEASTLNGTLTRELQPPLTERRRAGTETRKVPKLPSASQARAKVRDF